MLRRLPGHSARQLCDGAATERVGIEDARVEFDVGASQTLRGVSCKAGEPVGSRQELISTWAELSSSAGCYLGHRHSGTTTAKRAQRDNHSKTGTAGQPQQDGHSGTITARQQQTLHTVPPYISATLSQLLQQCHRVARLWLQSRWPVAED